MSVVTTVMMTENNGDRGDEDDDEGADRQDAVSQDADSQEDEEQDGEGRKHDEGVVENVCMVPAQKNAYKAPVSMSTATATAMSGNSKTTFLMEICPLF